MKNKKILSLILALALVFSMAVPAFAEEEAAPVAPYVIGDVKGKLVILHTNDTHGADMAVEGKTIGTAGVAQLKKDFEAAGAEVLLMSAGDAIQGQPLVSLSKGATAVDFMNAAGYDVMVPGNHEMDYGSENLMALAKNMKFAVLGADILDEKTSKPVFDANKIFTTASGLKVGVFGLATPETLTKADATKMVGITFPQGKELYALAQGQVDALKKQGAQLIVCLGHLGVDEETATAGNRSVDVVNNVTGIDLFVDGHSHTEMKAGAPVNLKGYPTFKNDSKTLIVSTGTALVNVGVVVYDKAAKTLTPDLIAAAAYTKVDETVAKLVTDKNTEVDKELSVVFGKTEIELNGAKDPGNRTMETNLGNFAADALLWSASKTLGEGKVDAAITNGGGIRAAIPAGEISMKTMKTVFPFGNTVATVKVTGTQLLEALEAGTYCTPTTIGGFPQVSGIEFTVNTAVEYAAGPQYPASTYYAPAAPGSRVSIQTVGGAAFDPAKLYTIATNDFTAKGNDTYCVFKTANLVNPWTDTATPMEDALVSYTKDVLGGTITAEKYGKTEGRITVLASDITPGSWYVEPVYAACIAGLMNGTGGNKFTPEGIVTRATIIQTLYNMDGAPVATGETAFTDIAGKWYAPAATWAQANGVIQVPASGLFGGSDVVTRAEMAILINNFLTATMGLEMPAGMAIREVADYDKIPADALGAMTNCFNAGIILGKDSGLLDPSGNAKRAEMAKILMAVKLFVAEHVPAMAG